MTRWWEEYEPAQREHSEREAHRELLRLYQLTGRPLLETDRGVCNDCDLVTSRYQHGPRELCIHCVANRRRAAERIAA